MNRPNRRRRGSKGAAMRRQGATDFDRFEMPISPGTPERPAGDVGVGEKRDRPSVTGARGISVLGRGAFRVRQTEDDFLAVWGEADPAEVARRDPPFATAPEMDHIEGLLAGIG